MKLHWSPRSPFVRKVMIVLHETCQIEEVKLIRSPVAMAAVPNPDVLADNPLGKIPTLVLEDGTALFDSRVICGFLTERAGKLIATETKERLLQARWEALGDGMTDILLLWRIERTREEKADPVICAAFETKIRATVTRLELEAPVLAATPIGLGQIAIFCALGQLEFRWPGTGWREAFPKLAAWFAVLETCSAFAATAVVDDAVVAGPPVLAQPVAFTFEQS